MPDSKAKMLFMAIDGLEYDLALKINEKLGLQCGLLKSLPNNMNTSGPAWTSIYTGVTPDKHKVTSIWGQKISKKRTIHNAVPKTSEGYSTLEYPCIWDYLSYAGLTCGLFGPPITFPVRMNKRWAIAGFCRSPKADDSYLYYIDSGYIDKLHDVEMDVVESFVRLIGSDIMKDWAKIKTRTEELSEILSICNDNYGKRFNLLEELLVALPVDCVFVSLEIMDRLGHLGYPIEKDLVVGFLGVWITYLKQHINPDFIIGVSDHGFAHGGHTYEGMIMTNSDIPLPGSVLEVKDYILQNMNIEASSEVSIAQLFTGKEWDQEDEEVKKILTSLGYI